MSDKSRLRMLQALPLELKVEMTKRRIQEFVDHVGGWDNVYISFSGGKDSTVLCEIAREMNENVKIMFVNTGMEFPEIVEFVKEKRDVYGWNIDITNPKMYFKDVIKKYGYPVLSKEVSMAISRYRNTNREDQKDYRLNGKIVDGKKFTAGTIPKKYHNIAKNGKFKISEKCCDVMKKEPAKRYSKKSERHPIIGTMVVESMNRKRAWEQRGCNSFEGKSIQSNPLSIWKEDDIWHYIKINNVEIAKPYKMGYKRTGCTGCLFGCHLENGINRIQRLEKTHPKLHKMYLDHFGYKEIMDELGIPYTADSIKWYLEEEITSKDQKKLF